MGEVLARYELHVDTASGPRPCAYNNLLLVMT